MHVNDSFFRMQQFPKSTQTHANLILVISESGGSKKMELPRLENGIPKRKPHSLRCGRPPLYDPGHAASSANSCPPRDEHLKECLDFPKVVQRAKQAA